MRNGFLFFLGLFGALVLSWGGVMLWPNHQLGKLAPYFDENDAKAYPERISGQAAQGRLVYEDIGCAACHTQQVHRPSTSADKARGWGERQSVARDYIYDTHVQLGESRIGPDLANVGGRKPAYDADDFYMMLYGGNGAMPPYQFLFQRRAIAGRQASDEALSLRGKLAPPVGIEIVPTPRARALVAYLLSLNHPYEYPEAHPYEAPAEKKEGSK